MNANRKSPGGSSDAEARQAACDLAVEALGYLAGDPELLSRFLALTGIDPDAVRSAAEESGFLAGILDYVAADERLLLAFATHAGVGPEEIETARQALAVADWERDMP